MPRKKVIRVFQITSVSLIWVLVISVAVWIMNLIQVSRKLHDAFNASLAISIVAIPIFFTLAALLTYVFIGLQKDRK